MTFQKREPWCKKRKASSNILMWEYNLITNSNNQKLCIFKSKIKTRRKIFLFLFLIFWLSLSSCHFQRIKLIKLFFTKYKGKLLRVTMVTIHTQLTVSIVLWMIITVTLIHILFKMSCVIIYGHNRLKSLSWIDFSCMFNINLRSFIHNASAIFHFHLLLWKFLSIILKSMVLTFLCDFSMLWFHTCNVLSLTWWSFIVIRQAFSPRENKRS